MLRFPKTGCGTFSSGDGKRIQIRAGEHGVQPILVLPQSAIHCFLIAELTHDNPKRVLHPTAQRRFAVFNVAFPVNSVVTDPGKTPEAAVNTGIIEKR